MQLDFYDKKADFNQFYDTTRLIISNKINMANQKVYECIVLWYGRDDCQILDNKTGKFESLRSKDNRKVLVQIDLESLQNDPNYCNAVMKDKKRVERYLEAGLQETPEQPCGEYIGGVRQTEKGYGKFFSQAVGEASHNSVLMVNRRKENREKIANLKQEEVARKEAQIKKLQEEINEISR